jgi:hypothetical protein
MIETSAKWVLIFYMVYAPNGIEQSVTHQRNETDFSTLAECQKYANDRLAVIDVAPDYNPYFACVPIEAVGANPEKTATE